MTDSPLFSFCIFTYNRALLLTQLLDQIVTVKNTFPAGMIEVVISDNASTDQTVALITERYRDQGFKIAVQERNLGLTRNWLQSINQSTGTYVWPYADDDLLDVPLVIATINDHLRQATGDFYHMNYAKGIYLDDPRTCAAMKAIHHGVDRDLSFPDMASLIPYCGIFSRGIVIMGNIFRGDLVRHRDFEDCFLLNDIVEQVEIMLGTFKYKKCVLLHQCLMLHLHPPLARWIDELKGNLPDSYVWTIASMRRFVRMLQNGIIEPSLLDDDGMIHVLKSDDNKYVTVREKLPQHLYNATLDFMKEIKRPLDKKDTSTIADFAGYLSAPDMQQLFLQLEKYGETNDPALLTQLEQARLHVDKNLLAVMWQSSTCPAYEKYCDKVIDTSHLGIRDTKTQLKKSLDAK